MDQVQLSATACDFVSPRPSVAALCTLEGVQSVCAPEATVLRSERSRGEEEIQVKRELVEEGMIRYPVDA